jgi:hypothetical protein
MQTNDHIQIHLSSNNAINKFNSYLEFEFPLIEIDTQSTIYLSLQHAVIPYSFYNINETNNKLEFIINSLLDDNTPESIFISIGNYTASTLLLEIQNLLLKSGFYIKYNNINNKYEFTHNANDFIILNTSTSLSLLGFTESNHESKNRYLISDIIANLAPVRCLCISTGYNSNSIRLSSLYNSNILCSIPVNQNPYTIISYTNLTNHSINLNTNYLSNIAIKITDQNNNFINFNNLDWSVTLELNFRSF